MSKEGNNGRSKGPRTERFAGGAQDCSRPVALRATAFDGKKEVTLAVEGCLWAPIGQAAQCFPGSGRRFALSPSYFFEGIVTYMALNNVAFRGRVEKQGFWELQWSKQWGCPFLLLCLATVFKELRVTAQLPTACRRSWLGDQKLP